MKTVVIIKRKQFNHFRLAMQKTNKEIAEKLGISRVYLSQVTSETAPSYYPSGALRTKMLKLFRCKFDDLFKITEIDPEKISKKSRRSSSVA